MEHVDLDVPAVVTIGGSQRKFEHAYEAIRHAVELCPEEDRRGLRIRMASGEELNWDAVEQIYQTHLVGP